MRRTGLVIVATALALAAAGCASQSVTVSTRPELNPDAIDHPEKGGLPAAVESPFQDANLVKTQIPPVLTVAQQAPYAPPDPVTCSQITEDVAALDDALGDDFDIHEAEDPEHRKGRVAGETALGFAMDAENNFIPFRGWVRRLTGASKHANEVRAAVYAGRVRRSYLKGVGQALGCRWPAAPKGSAPLQPARQPAPRPPSSRRSR
jgi:hypothetical protein